MLAPMALLATAAGLNACHDPAPIGSATEASTSCEGAYLDAGGRCRRPNGWFAKKSCCEVQIAAYPSERRSLEAYECPADAEAIPVAFFDADSTLRISRSGTPTASHEEDVYILPFVAPTVASLHEQGYLVAIVSNQGGVAAGITPFEVAEGAVVFVASQLEQLGAKISYVDFADQKDEFRKPKTGMADHLDGLLESKCGVGIDWDASFMVGDAGYKKNVDEPHPDGRPADDFSNSDRKFAEALEIPFSEPADYFGWADYGFHNVRYKSQLFGVLEAMEAELSALEESGDDPSKATALAEELDGLRVINDLD
jgi:DNA 3'-phosphatase